MIALTAREPDTRHGADEALQKVNKLHNEVLLQLHDAVGAHLGSMRDVGIVNDLIRKVHDDARA